MLQHFFFGQVKYQNTIIQSDSFIGIENLLIYQACLVGQKATFFLCLVKIMPINI